VLVSLVKIFRELRGGRLFHEKSNDYADIWRSRHLASCGVVADWADKNFVSLRQTCVTEAEPAG
jgi:hypothetical protein